ENTEVGARSAVSDEQANGAGQHHGGSEKHTALQHTPDDALERALRVAGRPGHMAPLNPLYNISSASTTTTTVNNRRSHTVCAPPSSRAPTSAPASTPSMTGKGSPGSLYPRRRYPPPPA